MTISSDALAIVILLVVLTVFDIAALHRGVDSRDNHPVLSA